jgi:hypothetical protein
MRVHTLIGDAVIVQVKVAEAMHGARINVQPHYRYFSEGLLTAETWVVLVMECLELFREQSDFLIPQLAVAKVQQTHIIARPHRANRQQGPR